MRGLCGDARTGFVRQTDLTTKLTTKLVVNYRQWRIFVDVLPPLTCIFARRETATDGQILHDAQGAGGSIPSTPTPERSWSETLSVS